jgi:hypothetical protein
MFFPGQLSLLPCLGTRGMLLGAGKNIYSAPFAARRFITCKKLFNRPMKHLRVLKTLIHGRETNKRYFVNLLQTPHDNLANRSTRYLGLSQKLNITLNYLDETPQIITRN